MHPYYYKYHPNQLSSMHSPSFGSLAVTLGPYRLNCALQAGGLVVRVGVSETCGERVILNSMTTREDQLELVVGCVRNANETHYHLRQEEESVLRRVNELQGYVRDLQRRLETQSKSRKDLGHTHRSQRHYSQGITHQASLGLIHERGGQALSGIAQKQAEQNAKLEMLNDMLQEKLMKRDGDLLDLERTLLEREELIRQLAQKLIVANIQKEEYFNQYEKILQNTVFHHEESPLKPRTQSLQRQQQQMREEGEIVVEQAQIVVLPVEDEEEMSSDVHTI